MKRASALLVIACLAQVAHSLIADWIRSQIDDAQRLLNMTGEPANHLKIPKQHYDVLLELLVKLSGETPEQCKKECESASQARIEHYIDSFSSDPTFDAIPDDASEITEYEIETAGSTLTDIPLKTENVAIVLQQLENAGRLPLVQQLKRYKAIAEKYANALVQYTETGSIAVSDVALSFKPKIRYPNSVQTVVRESGAPINDTTALSLSHNGSNQIELDSALYKVDMFYDHASTQEALFRGEFEPLVQQSLVGANVAVFAFGQSGSGKTYTMFNSDCAFKKSPKCNTIHQSDGMALRTIDMLLKSLTPEQSLEMSFVQVSGTGVTDLLSPKRQALSSAKIQLRNATKNIIYTQPKTQEASVASVMSVKAARDTLNAALKRRETASTSFNDVSSRTHAVLALRINNGRTSSVFAIVDLAGTERSNGEKYNMPCRVDTIQINEALTSLKTMMLSGTRQNTQLSKVIADVVLGVDTGIAKAGGERTRMNKSINKFIFTTRRDLDELAQTTETLKFCRDIGTIGRRAELKSDLTSASSPVIAIESQQHTLSRHSISTPPRASALSSASRDGAAGAQLGRARRSMAASSTTRQLFTGTNESFPLKRN